MWPAKGAGAQRTRRRLVTARDAAAGLHFAV
jgi:hypothetical protein